MGNHKSIGSVTRFVLLSLAVALSSSALATSLTNVLFITPLGWYYGTFQTKLTNAPALATDANGLLIQTNITSVATNVVNVAAGTNTIAVTNLSGTLVTISATGNGTTNGAQLASYIGTNPVQIANSLLGTNANSSIILNSNSVAMGGWDYLAGFWGIATALSNINQTGVSGLVPALTYLTNNIGGGSSITTNAPIAFTGPLTIGGSSGYMAFDTNGSQTLFSSNGVVQVWRDAGTNPIVSIIATDSVPVHVYRSAQFDSNVTFSGSVSLPMKTMPYVIPTTSGSISIDPTNGNDQALTLTGTATIDGVAGDAAKTSIQHVRLDLIAGANSVTWGSTYIISSTGLTVSTSGTSSYLFDQPYGTNRWYVTQLH